MSETKKQTNSQLIVPFWKAADMNRRLSYAWLRTRAVHCRRTHNRRASARLLSQTARVRNQKLLFASNGEGGEEREKRTGASPVVWETGGGGRGGEIEDEVHARASARLGRRTNFAGFAVGRWVRE